MFTDMILSSLLQFPYATTIVTILAATHALAIAIVNLTPTPTRDEVSPWVDTVYRYIEMAAGIVNQGNVKS